MRPEIIQRRILVSLIGLVEWAGAISKLQMRSMSINVELVSALVAEGAMSETAAIEIVKQATDLLNETTAEINHLLDTVMVQLDDIAPNRTDSSVT